MNCDNWPAIRQEIVQKNRISVPQTKKMLLFGTFSCLALRYRKSSFTRGKTQKPDNLTGELCRKKLLRKNGPQTLTVNNMLTEWNGPRQTLTVNNDEIVLNWRGTLQSPSIWVIETQQGPSFLCVPLDKILMSHVTQCAHIVHTSVRWKVAAYSWHPTTE